MTDIFCIITLPYCKSTVIYCTELELLYPTIRKNVYFHLRCTWITGPVNEFKKKTIIFSEINISLKCHSKKDVKIGFLFFSLSRFFLEVYPSFSTWPSPLQPLSCQIFSCVEWLYRLICHWLIYCSNHNAYCSRRYYRYNIIQRNQHKRMEFECYLQNMLFNHQESMDMSTQRTSMDIFCWFWVNWLVF